MTEGAVAHKHDKAVTPEMPTMTTDSPFGCDVNLLFGGIWASYHRVAARHESPALARAASQ